MTYLSEKRMHYLYSKENLSRLRYLNKLLRTKRLHPSISSDSYELGYVLGVICGDGNVRRWTVRLGCTDKDFATFFKMQLEKWSKLNSRISKKVYSNPNWKPMFTVELHSIEVCNFLRNFNLDSLKNSSEAMKSGFLRGFFDSEGSVNCTYYKAGKYLTCIRTVEVYNTNLTLLQLCNTLLNSLGIKTRGIKGRRLNNRRWKKEYRLALQTNPENIARFKSKIGFSIKRKQKMLEKILSSYRSRQKFWTESELSFLRENYMQMEDQEIAEKLNRTKCSIYRKRVRLNLKKR